MSNKFDGYYTSLKDQTNNQPGLYLFSCSICVIWTVYVLFFNSRVIGALLTFVINVYLKRRQQLAYLNPSTSSASNSGELSQPVWIKIRSVSISFLSGKIMFRGIHYATLDYMLYIQDGWLTFAYWKPSFYTVLIINIINYLKTLKNQINFLFQITQLKN